MTHHWGQVPTAPQPPQWHQALPSRPPPRRSNTTSTVTILLASIVSLILHTAALLTLSDLDDNLGPGLDLGILNPRSGEEPAATNPMRTYPDPKLSDFTLKVKELRRQKFGPAGANITYYIVADWGPAYDPDKTYALVYEVHGGEYGPVRNYIEVRGDHHKIENDQFISTSRVNQRIIVKAVAVEELAGAMFTPRSCQPQ